MMNITGEVLQEVAHIEQDLHEFRGVRALWANWVANGALTCWHSFHANEQHAAQIAADLKSEQIDVLFRIISRAQNLARMLTSEPLPKDTDAAEGDA